MLGLRFSQGGSSMTWLSIVISQCWRCRSEMKMQNLELPLRVGMFRLFLEMTVLAFSLIMWGFRVLFYYTLLIRAFMRSWFTHAAVSTRVIQIHPYSQVCSTHFVKGCFAEYHSGLSLPSLIWFSGPASLWCTLQAHSVHLKLPLLVESQTSLGSPSGYLPSGEKFFKFRMRYQGFSFLFLSPIPAILFLFPLSTAPQGTKQLDNSSISEGSCTFSPHTLPPLEVNAVRVGSIHRALRANQISSAVRKKYDLPEGREDQLWVTREAVLNITVSEESNNWMIWPMFVWFIIRLIFEVKIRVLLRTIRILGG